MSLEPGQQIVVQNVGGPGGGLGAQQVANTEAAGYTILRRTVSMLMDLAKAEPLAYASSGSGTPRALGVTTTERAPGLPDEGAIAETLRTGRACDGQDGEVRTRGPRCVREHGLNQPA